MKSVYSESSKVRITIALFVATFLAAIEGTIVGTAMPSITRELQGVQQYSWIISLYLLATVITTPIYGKLSDLYGRKRMFVIGAIIFLAGSMLSGIAQSIDGLIIYRIIQGLGAGALTTIPYTIIGDLYSFEKRAKVQGWMASIWGIAGISGPLVGGLLVDYVSWRAIFYMNLPFGIAALILLSMAMKEKLEKKKRHIDYPGIIVFSAGMICFLYAISLLQGEGSGGDISVGVTSALFGISAVLIVLFGFIEKKSPEPIIPLQLFRNRIITFANVSSFLLCVISVAVIFYLPLWFQGVFGKSATYSGILMIPLSIAWPLGSILAGNMITKRGMRSICIVSSCILLISSTGFAFVDSSSSLLLLIFYTFLAGISFGLTLTSLTVAVTSAVGRELRGASVATNNFIRTLGQTIGITVFGLLLHTGTANEIDAAVLESSIHHIFTWVAWLSIIMLLLSLMTPNLAQEEEEKTQAESQLT